MFESECVHIEFLLDLLNHQGENICAIKSSLLMIFLHQVVLKLFFGCSHNISFPDPEGGDQPEE